jgi:excisionase family DNA binding protein
MSAPSEPVKSASTLPLAAASLRLRRRPGRPRTRPQPAPRHVSSHVDAEPRESAAVPLVRRTSGPANVPRPLDVEGAAVYLGVSPWTVRDLVERGTLSRVALPGVRRLLFDRCDLDRLVETSRLTAQ